jgi:hypothetical protein
VNLANATSPVPTPQGGAIVPGTYVLTAADDYGSGQSGWLRQTIRLTAIGGDGGAAEGGDDAAAGDAGSEPDAAVDAGTAAASFTFESITVTNANPLATESGMLGFSNPTTVAIMLTCGGTTAPFIEGYTATSTTLAFIANPRVLTFTKQ